MPTTTTPSNILVLDASALAASALARLLRLEGHRVTVSQSVTEACARCDAEAVDLIITDIEFPDGSGLSVLARARSIGAARGIVVSAQADEPYRRAAARAGFDAYLLKPVKWQQFRTLVHRLVHPATRIRKQPLTRLSRS